MIAHSQTLNKRKRKQEIIRFTEFPFLIKIKLIITMCKVAGIVLSEFFEHTELYRFNRLLT